MKFAALITIFCWGTHTVSSKPITAFFLPGDLEDYVKMTRHPGTDLSEISICLRLDTFIVVADVAVMTSGIEAGTIDEHVWVLGMLSVYSLLQTQSKQD